MSGDDAPASSAVLSEVFDGIGLITMNRPERRNAVNGTLAAGLHAAIEDMADNARVRVVVLTGAAPPGSTGGFCSGGDRSVGPEDIAGLELGVPPNALDGDLSRHDSHAAMRLHQMPKPTIAMVGGPAIGAGLSLAASCDLRFASDDAVFMAGFLSVGLTGDYGGTYFWTRIAGTAVARRLYLLDEKLSATDALSLGMVHHVVPAADLRDHTMAVASRLASLPRRTLARLKLNLNLAEDDVERRRHLFAHEAAAQRAASDH